MTLEVILPSSEEHLRTAANMFFCALSSPVPRALSVLLCGAFLASSVLLPAYDDPFSDDEQLLSSFPRLEHPVAEKFSEFVHDLQAYEHDRAIFEYVLDEALARYVCSSSKKAEEGVTRKMERLEKAPEWRSVQNLAHFSRWVDGPLGRSAEDARRVVGRVAQWRDRFIEADRRLLSSAPEAERVLRGIENPNSLEKAMLREVQEALDLRKADGSRRSWGFLLRRGRAAALDVWRGDRPLFRRWRDLPGGESCCKRPRRQ